MQTLTREQTRGFEPEMIAAAMLSHRIMGIMAHWREYTGMRTQRCFGDFCS